jgi:hypothetical protein
MTTTATTTKTTREILDLLIETFSKIGSMPSQASKAVTQSLPTAKIPSPLKEAVTHLTEVSGVSSQTWLKVVFDPKTKEFRGIKNPEIALVKGEPSVILDGSYFSANDLIKNSTICFEERGEKKDKNLAYFAVCRNPEVSGCELLPLKLWTDPAVQLDCEKLKKDKKYLIKSLFEYIFSAQTLTPGKHAVTKYGKTGNFLSFTVNGLQYHCKKEFISRFDELKLADKPINIIVDSTTQSEINGEKIVYKPIYVDGYAPTMSIKNFIAKIGLMPSEEELAQNKMIMFTNPVMLTLREIITTQYTDKEGTTVKQDAVVCQYTDLDGVASTITLRCNSPLKRAIDNGKFTINEGENYGDDYFIKIVGVKPGKRGLEFQLGYEVPDKAPIDDSMHDLASSMGFNL